jgi:hypothetical protein
LFHHPPSAPTAGTIKVVVEGTIVRVARTEEMLPVPLGKERKGGEKAQRISVPARKIQVTGHLEVIKIREPSHEIMGD